MQQTDLLVFADQTGAQYPTDPFKFSWSQNASIDGLHLALKRLSADSKALTLWKGRSGIELFVCLSSSFVCPPGREIPFLPFPISIQLSRYSYLYSNVSFRLALAHSHLTDHFFAIWEPQNPLINEFYGVQNRHSTNFEASKHWYVRTVTRSLSFRSFSLSHKLYRRRGPYDDPILCGYHDFPLPKKSPEFSILTRQDYWVLKKRKYRPVIFFCVFLSSVAPTFVHPTLKMCYIWQWYVLENLVGEKETFNSASIWATDKRLGLMAFYY